MLWFTRLIVFLGYGIPAGDFTGNLRAIDGGNITCYEDLLPTLDRRAVFQTPQIIDRLKPVRYLLGLIYAFGSKVSCVQP